MIRNIYIVSLMALLLFSSANAASDCSDVTKISNEDLAIILIEETYKKAAKACDKEKAENLIKCRPKLGLLGNIWLHVTGTTKDYDRCVDLAVIKYVSCRHGAKMDACKKLHPTQAQGRAAPTPPATTTPVP